MLLEPLARQSDGRIGGSFYCECAICTTIGRGLRNYYDLSEPIPDRMLELLKQLDDDGGQKQLIDGVHAEVRSRSIDEFGGGARRDQAWAA
jgi:hypothetical protein